MFDRAIATLAARQHGLVARAQAVGRGGTAEMIDHRVRTGRWVRVARGVYRLAGVPVTWHQRALAACLVSDGVLSHRSAAALFGISGFRPGPLHVTVAPNRSSRSPLATVHRSRLTARERGAKDRIPVTRPGRTLVDLVATVPAALLEEAVDDVLCRRLVSLDRLAASGPIPKVLRTILGAWNEESEPHTIAEMRLVRALLEHGLPQPSRQFVIVEAAARVDLAYPEYRLALELDSFRWHAGKGPFASDRARGNRIVAAGWALLRATPGTEDATAATAARLLLGRPACVA